MIGGIISRALQAGHFPILLVFKVWVLFVVPTAKGLRPRGLETTGARQGASGRDPCTSVSRITWHHIIVSSAL